MRSTNRTTARRAAALETAPRHRRIGAAPAAAQQASQQSLDGTVGQDPVGAAVKTAISPDAPSAHAHFMHSATRQPKPGTPVFLDWVPIGRSGYDRGAHLLSGISSGEARVLRRSFAVAMARPKRLHSYVRNRGCNLRLASHSPSLATIHFRLAEDRLRTSSLQRFGHLPSTWATEIDQVSGWWVVRPEVAALRAAVFCQEE